MSKKLSVILLMSFYSFQSFSQQNPDNASDTLRKYAINIFMEEVPDYFKEEVPFVNYVRNKNVADLVIIQTQQMTGSGGAEFTFFIEGQFKYEGVRDTVKFSQYPDDTEDLIRSRAVRTFKLGLVKYILDTPLMDYLDITFSQPISSNVSSDSWNNWVFRASVQGSIDRNKTTKSDIIGTSIMAGRVTDEWRINSGIYFNNSHTLYNYGDIEVSNTNRSSLVWGDVVKSLNDHWSLGVSADVVNSTFSNYNLQLMLYPSIEYNFFPYSESTRRMFRLNYHVQFGYHDYVDTTAFFKTEEILWSQRATASFTTIQSWGNINIAAHWRNYLHDFSLNNLSLYTSLDWRIAKGLNIKLSAGYKFIHDQVSLRKGDASVEDVLLQRHELSTNYSFETSFGLTYTFGSIYNNVVNPRIEELF
jgi:hypothetical protein